MDDEFCHNQENTGCSDNNTLLLEALHPTPPRRENTVPPSLLSSHLHTSTVVQLLADDNFL